jgi:hypothetical protein
MGVELIFSKWPFERIEDAKELANKESVDELKQLLGVPELDNCIIEIPKKNASNYPSKIDSKELKNFFADYAGLRVFVLSKEVGQKSTLTFP